MSIYSDQEAMSSLPMGFGMALLQNKAARDAFDALPMDQQTRILEGVHEIQSKAEMQQYVASIPTLR